MTPTNRQVPGFPIRTPSDQRSVDNSPRTIAASHVLHQHDVPRHPLCAHKTKTLSQIFGRMLPVSNIRLATINKNNRRSRPLCSSHTTPPTPNHQTIPVSDGVQARHNTCVLRQTPNNVTRLCFVVRVYRTHAQPVTTRFSPTRQPHTKQHSFSRLLVWRIHVSKKLLRKEVIQPHLPVRLPCYDFVPIADPTFDTTPQRGASGFGCYQLS